MTETASAPTGVAAGRLDQAARPGPEHERMNVVIGRWITEGHTVDPDGSPGIKILASDVYEWAPGGFFILHAAYGRMGDFGGGGIEIIGYDRASQTYPVHFFDSQGNATRHTIAMQDDRAWIWQGEHTRCTAVFSDDGLTQIAHHERSDDGVHWVRSMDVTLRKVE